MSLVAFAEEVGAIDRICVQGGATQWAVGGDVDAGARTVHAPVGVAEYSPAEMTVRVLAGTTIADLHGVLAAAGQTTVLAGPIGATVGGVLAVGRSGLRRLRVGPLRDALLQLRYVAADGRLITAGGPTVKNVTGYDLCRLMVGSLGVLGCFAEAILRTRPVPEVSHWWRFPGDPFVARQRLYRPSAMLWNGVESYVLLEGHAVDVDAQASLLHPFDACRSDGPPPLPPYRASVAPADIGNFVQNAAGPWVAEVGVGIVHCTHAVPAVAPTAAVRVLHQRVRAAFDPTGRLNPGRDPLARGGR